MTSFVGTLIKLRRNEMKPPPFTGEVAAEG